MAMLGVSLQQLGGLFERQFMVAYWGPIFIGAAFLAAVVALARGISTAIADFAGLSAIEQILYGAAILIGITVIAYVLSVLTMPMIRIYEGHWPPWIRTLAYPLVAWQKHRHSSILDRMEENPGKDNTISPAYREALYRYYSTYPRNPKLVKPTSIGNILAAAEEYPRLRYNVNAALWWPRLFAVMPEAHRGQVEASILPMIALLNLTTIVFLVGLGGGAWLILAQGLHLWAIVCIIIGLILAFLCYRAAAIQAVRYTLTVRTAFDLYRFDLLKQMHIPLPSPKEERALWDHLEKWLYIGDLRSIVARYDHNEIPTSSP